MIAHKNCKTSVHKVVRKKNKLYPYKIKIVQSLKVPDYEKSESFARTVMDLINADVTFPWPPRSPDVNPFDFFSFGLCKIKTMKVTLIS